MKRRFQYKLALLMIGATLLTGCGNNEETMAETNEITKTSEVIDVGEAFPQAGEGSETEYKTSEIGKVEDSKLNESKDAVENTSEEVSKEKEAVSSKKNKKASKGSIKVATIGSPNTEILQQAALLLEDQGYQLEINVCEDYLTPNQMVVEGTVDCNYYQHEAFLERYNIEHQTTLSEIDKAFYEPNVILSKKITDLTQVTKGMKVAISDNPTAVARALWLLQEAELLTLMSDADMNTVVGDIEENSKGLELVFVEEAQLLGQLEEADLIVCAKGLAMQEAINIRDMLLAEENSNSMMAQKLAQVVVASDATNPKAITLAEVLASEEMKQFIATKYQGSICAMEDAMEETETEENSSDTENGKETEEKE